MGGKKETRDTYLGVYVKRGPGYLYLCGMGKKDSLISAGYTRTAEQNHDKGISFVRAGLFLYSYLSVIERIDRAVTAIHKRKQKKKKPKTK